MDRTIRIAVWGVGALGAIVALMAQVPFQTAQTNLATYAEAVGLTQLANALPVYADRWATFLGLMAFIGAMLEYQWLTQRKPDLTNSPRQTEPAISRAHFHPLEEFQPVAPKPKYYSRTDKERLSDLYGELSQLLLANGANGSGGLYSALVGLERQFSLLGPSFQNAKPEQVESVVATWHQVYDASEQMRAAIYGGQGIVRKKEYIAYGDELRAVLQDGDHSPMQAIQEALGPYNQVLGALQLALQHQDRALVQLLMEVSAAPITDFSRAIREFQKWEFDANQRIQEKRNELRDG